MVDEDWATNLLPPTVSLEEMACLVARYSARLYPSLPFLNGFCLLIRRQALQEGLFGTGQDTTAGDSAAAQTPSQRPLSALILSTGSPGELWTGMESCSLG